VLGEISTATNAVRGTRQLVEVLANGGLARVTRQLVEVLASTDGKTRISRQLVELLASPEENDMSAAFRETISAIGLTDDSQGEAAFIHALLKYANANHSGLDVLSNPLAEAIRRLEAAGINPHALARIKQLLYDRLDKYDRGVR